MDPKALPDVPSRAIVSFLPLQQIIVSLPLLHSRFGSIRESVLKSNQRLELYIGNVKEIERKKCWSHLGVPLASHLVDSTGCPLYPDTSYHRLHLLTLTQHSVEQLSTLMPNLTYLEVAIADVDLSVIPHLITLLTFWGPSLQTLKLLIREFASPNEEYLQLSYLPTVASHLRPLIHLINNQLLSLESLSLDLDDSLVDRYKEGLLEKIDYAVANALGFRHVPLNGPQMPEMENAIRRLHLLLQEVAVFLNQEPPAEAVNVAEVLAQEENIRWQLYQKHRFTTDVLFSGETTILGQLREFSIDTGREAFLLQPFILQALERYGSNRLTSIAIDEANTWGHAWNLASLAHHRFASRFTSVPNPYDPAVQHDTPFLPLFTNLKGFTVRWYNLGPTQMARLSGLASLPNLQYLKLDFFTSDTPHLNASFASLPAFSSLAVLEIFLYHRGRESALTHECLQVPYWAHLFPSVQIIKLLHDGTPCLSCFPNEISLMHLPIETVLPCVKRLIAPLRELPSLRKIFYQQNEQIAVVAEFTSEGELAQTHEYV